MNGYNGVIKSARIWKSIKGHWHLEGDVYDNEIYPEGMDINTSHIVSATIHSTGLGVKTKNSNYFVPYAYSDINTIRKIIHLSEEGAF